MPTERKAKDIYLCVDINAILKMFDQSEKLIYQGQSNDPNLSYEHGILNTLRWLFGETSETPIDINCIDCIDCVEFLQKEYQTIQQRVDNIRNNIKFPLRNNCQCELCRKVWR